MMNCYPLMPLILTFLLGASALGENKFEHEIFRVQNLDNKGSRLLFCRTSRATDCFNKQ